VLVILSGCSGVGKNTIISRLLVDMEKYELLPTYTTREMRENEEQGKPYYFISDEEFKGRLRDGELYESEIVHEHFYGTSRNLLLEKKKSKKILIKDIDVKGTQNLVKLAKKDIDILTFFLYVKSKDILIERLKGRGEKNIELRLSRYDMEMQYANQYSYIIDNEDMEKTINIIESLIAFEQSNNILLPTEGIRDINMEVVEKYAQSYRAGEDLSSIFITEKNGKWYIVDGHHRYLASIMAGVRIPKEVIESKYFDKVEAYSWEDLVEEIKKI